MSSCCHVCGTNTNSVCSGCKHIRYCNVEHQRKDWKRHKKMCKKWKRELMRANINDFKNKKKTQKKRTFVWFTDFVNQIGSIFFHYLSIIDLDTIQKSNVFNKNLIFIIPQKQRLSIYLNEFDIKQRKKLFNENKYPTLEAWCEERNDLFFILNVKMSCLKCGINKLLNIKKILLYSLKKAKQIKSKDIPNINMFVEIDNYSFIKNNVIKDNELKKFKINKHTNFKKMVLQSKNKETNGWMEYVWQSRHDIQQVLEQVSTYLLYPSLVDMYHWYSLHYFEEHPSHVGCVAYGTNFFIGHLINHDLKNNELQFAVYKSMWVYCD